MVPFVKVASVPEVDVKSLCSLDAPLLIAGLLDLDPVDFLEVAEFRATVLLDDDESGDFIFGTFLARMGDFFLDMEAT